MSRPRPTVYEVAQHAGVSTATVSRVLAGNDRVGAESRQRVLAAAAELGYVPSGAARDLASRRTGVLGLCFPDLVPDDGPDPDGGDAVFWYDEVIRSMERAARARGYAVLIAASHASDDVELVMQMAGRCDGLVVLARTVPTPVLERITQRIPVVVLAGPPEKNGIDGGIDHLDHLVVENAQGTAQLTRHLITVHGHEDLVFLGGSDSPDSAARFEGFRAALEAAGLPLPENPAIHGDLTTGGGRAAVERMLRSGRRPTALVCANDQMALGAVDALRSAGLSVPRDVAVTGFDGIQLGRHVRPALTTAVQPVRLLGQTAVRLLEERAAEMGRPATSVELPVRIELRGSCGCASGR